MSDSLEILASGAHPNVGHHMVGQSIMFDGWERGRIPLDAQVKSTPVNTDGYTQLTLTLTVTARTMRERHNNVQCGEPSAPNGAKLYVTVETMIGGRWQVLHTFAPQADTGSQVAQVTNIGTSVRASYAFWRSYTPEGTVTEKVAITWGLTAEALPEQPE
jgi:hypothetical protein